MSSITSANAVLMLGVSSLFSTPQQIQGFSTDDIFSVDPLESAETMMGVDGFLSAGFVYVPVKQGITLMADSPSNNVFDQWWAAQQQISDLYFANGSITLTALGKKYAMTRGALTTYPPLADAGRTLKPRKFVITWQSILPAPV